MEVTATDTSQIGTALHVNQGNLGMNLQTLYTENHFNAGILHFLGPNDV